MCADSATVSQFFWRKSLGHNQARYRQLDWHYSRELNTMARPVKAIATVASLAVLGCSIFAMSWVGLALLGY